MKKWLWFLVVLCLLPVALVSGESSAIATGGCSGGLIKGDVQGNIPSNWSLNDDCEIHHVPSQAALTQAKIPEEFWPVWNIPIPDHEVTRTKPGGNPRVPFSGAIIDEYEDLMDARNGATWQERLLETNRKHTKLQLQQDLQNSPNISDITRAAKEATDALEAKLNMQSGTTTTSSSSSTTTTIARLSVLPPPPPPPPGGPPAVMVGVTHNKKPPPPPGGAGAAAVTQDSSIAISATGLGASRAGEELDLIIADSAQLAKDPHCNNSPYMISAAPAVVDSSGNLPETQAQLGTIYWESAGEQGFQAPSLGAAKVCFAQAQDHHALATAPADLMIYASAVGAPVIYPPAQTTDSSGGAIWWVAVPQSAGITTLRFCYTGSVCTDRSIPSGSGSMTFAFSHTFSGTGTYVQTAEIVETGAKSAPAATQVHPQQGPRPEINPPVQFAVGCSARYTVRIPRDPTRTTTLHFDYGDGSSETVLIPQGDGTETVSFSHFFSSRLSAGTESQSRSDDDLTAVIEDAYEMIASGRDPRDAVELDPRTEGPHAYSQRATTVETGASSYALTL